MTRAFTARANTTFWLEIAPVLLAIRMASGMASMLDVMKTTSAASMAASAPLPIAAPTSAPASTGASLIPSPTNIALPFSARSFCKISSLSAGRSFAYTLSIPTSAATASAAASPSPVSIAERIPMDFKDLMASFASGLIVSAIWIVPASFPFTDI